MLLAGDAVDEYWIFPSMLNANPSPVPKGDDADILVAGAGSMEHLA